MDKIQKIRPETVEFIPLSELGISQEGMEDIIDSAITFGGSNRSLVTAEELDKQISWSDEEDEKKVTAVISHFGPLMYIDLEN